jgi:hypothetical protein
MGSGSTFQQINLDVGKCNDARRAWRVGTHVVFVTTGVPFAIMDSLAARTLIVEEKASRDFPRDTNIIGIKAHAK